MVLGFSSKKRETADKEAARKATEAALRRSSSYQHGKGRRSSLSGSAPARTDSDLSASSRGSSGRSSRRSSLSGSSHQQHRRPSSHHRPQVPDYGYNAEDQSDDEDFGCGDASPDATREPEHAQVQRCSGGSRRASLSGGLSSSSSKSSWDGQSTHNRRSRRASMSGASSSSGAKAHRRPSVSQPVSDRWLENPKRSSSKSAPANAKERIEKPKPVTRQSSLSQAMQSSLLGPADHEE